MEILSAFLHDIGKFAQRANQKLTIKNYYNYTHAAYSAEVLTKYKHIFNLSDEEIDYAAMHHNLKSDMDDEYWIIAAADRLASGFEREKWEGYNTNFADFKAQKLQNIFNEQKEFDLAKLSPNSIFPKNTPKGDYETLWQEFICDLEKVKSKKAIEYLYLKYTSFIPSSTSFKFKDFNPVKANIPLYEHSKTTAIFASVIDKLVQNGDKSVIDYYKYGKKNDFDKKPFLILFGDFYGIQNFIFDIKSKYASKMLRAKSAYIEILNFVITKYITKVVGIDEFCIISNNAGKFEILLDNTPDTIQKIENIKTELEDFCIDEFFGVAGVGIDYIECGIGDFIEKDSYKKLRQKIYQKVENMKLHKFSLHNRECKLNYEKFSNQEVCSYCGVRKANKDNICNFCEKFVKIGQNLAKKKYLSFTNKGIKIFKDYYISFFDENPIGEIYDIKDDEFSGYPKWHIGAYVPQEDDILTFEEIAKRSVKNSEDGVEALMAIKADVDFMGDFILNRGMSNSFAKYNFFSRMINYFFSVYVLYKMKNKDIYTIFAGGDDLYIIGAWDESLEFIREIREDFIRFCDNEMKLSAGCVMIKPNKPINYVSRIIEDAEMDAKSNQKNNIALFREVINFDDYIEEGEYILEELEEYQFSTGFLYKLIEFCEMSKRLKYSINMEDCMWISRFDYSFERNIGDNDKLKQFLKYNIDKFPELMKVVLFEYIYKRRKNGN